MTYSFIANCQTAVYTRIKQSAGLKYIYRPKSIHIAVQHSDSKITVRYSRNAVR